MLGGGCISVCVKDIRSTRSDARWRDYTENLFSVLCATPTDAATGTGVLCVTQRLSFG